MRESPENGKIVAPMKEKIKRIFGVTLIPQKLRLYTPWP
jgi:hypothetical protein